MKINIYKQFVLLCLLSSVFLLLSSAPAEAQQVNLSLDPPLVNAKIKPGKSIIVAYTVQNNGDPTNLQFLIRPFVPQGQLGSLSLLPQFEGPILFNLENADIALEKPFFFPSKEKRQAVVRITIPHGIPDGDYYYSVLAETVPAFSVAGQSTGIASAAIGSPLLITITESGLTEVKATIDEFMFTPDYIFTVGNNTVRIVDNAKELPILLTVRNEGRNLIQPRGTVTSQYGRDKKIFSIIPQNILSKSKRLIKVFSNSENGSANSTVNLTHLSIGSHRVALELSYGDDSAIEYKSLSFVALPIRLLTVLGILLGGVILAFIIRYFKKR